MAMNYWVCVPYIIVCLALSSYGAKAQSFMIEGTVLWSADSPDRVEILPLPEASQVGKVLQVVVPAFEQARLKKLFAKYQSDIWQFNLTQEEDHLELNSAFRLTDYSTTAVETANPQLVIQEGPYTDDPNQKSRSLAVSPEQLEVVYLTNLARIAEGLRPLKQVNLLHNAADGHSNRMAYKDFFAHCDVISKKGPFERMKDAGYNWNSAGENIAAGQNTADEVMNGGYGWMNSPGHRANILKPSFREIGVGYEFSNDSNKDQYDQNGDCHVDGQGGPFRKYWTQNFGLRNNVYPLIINNEQVLAESPNVNLHIYGPSGASHMRFRNEEQDWSEWVSYRSSYDWQLSTTSGSKTVFCEVRTNGGTVYKALDVIEMEFDCNKVNISNETISGNKRIDACEVTVGGNVTVYGNLIIEAQKTSLQAGSQVMEGATLEIKVKGSN